MKQEIDFKQTGIIKIILIIIGCIILAANKCHSQVGVNLNAGFTIKADPIVSAGVDWNVLSSGVVIGGGFKALTARDKPAFFNINAGYRYKLVEAGGGYSYALYSTDAPIKGLPCNYSTWNLYAKVYFNKFFVEYSKSSNSLTVGYREEF